jgi:hypothetical protein
VHRSGDTTQKASIKYQTEEMKDLMNSALENEDYDPINKGEIAFDVGEIEKVIDIKLADKDEDEYDDEEVYLIF